ncbi:MULTISPECIES: hypothetical protein [Pseudoalteromonas]|uniref:hypothetical protein n=1 Tax=Pseudoalteromonas TaxID=53246 RepID=UPI0027E41FFB|nr:hypothetical protein [Pseudoalteromonas piscicida]WMO14135.1 hypothetical protein NI376_00415 [Pseudoalteromonas piscicida]
MREIVIYGDGAMAKTIFPYIAQLYRVKCFTVERAYRTCSTLFGVPVHNLEELPEGDFDFVIAIGYGQLNQLRERYFSLMQKNGYKPGYFYCAEQKKAHHLEIGEGSIVLTQSAIHYGTKIGKNVFISSGVSIGHNCTIEDNVWINSGVTIAGNTTIGRNSVLCINSTVGNDIVIGQGNFIGAGTLITKNTIEFAAYATEPTKPLPIPSHTFIKLSKTTS